MAELANTEAIRIFIDYAREDEKLKAQLDTHLSVLKQKGLISTWDEQDLRAGDARQAELEKNLNNADIILCLLSPYFFKNQCGKLLEEHHVWEKIDAQNIKLIPILLQPTAGLENTRFGSLLIIPRDKKAVTEHNNKGRAFTEVIKEISKVVGDIHSNGDRQPDIIKPSERSITVYLESIEERKYERPADYTLSWRQYFVEEGFKGGHQLKDPENWNKLLLPQLYARKDTINRATDCRVIRVYGKARLSCWFAFGFVFSETSAYVLEVDQNQNYWRTDAVANETFPLIVTDRHDSPSGEVIDGGMGGTVAIGISLAGAHRLDDDVRAYLTQRQEKIAALALLAREDLQQRLKSAEEVAAFALTVRRHMKALVDYWNANKLLIFYEGPLSGACFIGHHLNEVCAQIQIMEKLETNDYVQTFLLR